MFDRPMITPLASGEASTGTRTDGSLQVPTSLAKSWHARTKRNTRKSKRNKRNRNGKWLLCKCLLCTRSPILRLTMVTATPTATSTLTRPEKRVDLARSAQGQAKVAPSVAVASPARTSTARATKSGARSGGDRRGASGSSAWR